MLLEWVQHELKSAQKWCWTNKKNVIIVIGLQLFLNVSDSASLDIIYPLENEIKGSVRKHESSEVVMWVLIH
jgi:hypothetical protein